MKKLKNKVAQTADTVQHKAQDIKNAIKDQNDEALLGRKLQADLYGSDGKEHIASKGSKITPRILERIKAHHMRHQAFTQSTS